MTPQEMAAKGHKNRTKKSYEDAINKARQTMLKKYGPNFYKDIRRGKKFTKVIPTLS